MLLPKDLKYSSEHQWLKIEGNQVKIGITDYAQKELGDIVYVELPAVGEKIAIRSVLANIESISKTSVIYAAISGEIMEVNDNLEHSPEWVNQDPYEKGWIAIIEPSEPRELKELMAAAAYAELIKK